MSCAKKSNVRYLPKVGPAEGDVVGSKLGAANTKAENKRMSHDPDMKIENHPALR
jgi:hypothetical protein